MKLKDKFTITITEKDRQMADGFCHVDSCLVATALNRRGIKDVSEAVDYVYIGLVQYRHNYVGRDNIGPFNNTKPFYDPHVVGLKIHFTRS